MKVIFLKDDRNFKRTFKRLNEFDPQCAREFGLKWPTTLLTLSGVPNGSVTTTSLPSAAKPVTSSAKDLAELWSSLSTWTILGTPAAQKLSR